MRTSIIFLALAALITACATTDPEPVRVIGGPDDLVPLAGEWSGTYESGMTGRSGSILFHLTDDPGGAHGDVLMVPRREMAHSGVEPNHGMFSGAAVLSIEFVRVSAGQVSGRIAPYPDPDDGGATLETSFTGRLAGDAIEGTFVTYSDRGVAPRRGTWRVQRKAVQ